MPTKSVKIYKLAKELNLASDTIIEFLKKKGFEIKNHMSVVTEDMLQAVNQHFKKEKDVAQRHQRKVEEFRSSRKRETGERRQADEQKPDAAAVAEASADEDVQDAPAEEPVSEQETAEAEPVTEAPVAGDEEQAEPSQEEVEEPVEEVTADDQSIETVERKGVSPLETLQARQTRGLTIKGKMDLTVKKEGEGTDKADDKKKKKKKKKVKAGEAKGKAETETESRDKTGKRKKGRRAEVDVQQVDKAIRETLSDIADEASTSRAAIKRRKREKREEEQLRIQEQIERDKTHIRVTEFVTVGELANMMGVTVAEVIQKIMSLGIMVSINQRLDKDTITLVADEFGFQLEFQEEFSAEELVDEEDAVESLVSRPPVVTIMGHVDHGKTSLLDYIRRTNVVAGESGGITQHIGAYEVSLPNGKGITFLDTPGHEAFTAMRARGAQVTDIVVLVVAADDSVMPQTVEAISHAQAGNVPIIVAINKVDKPEKNIDRIKQQLAERNLLVEDYGGRHQVVELSAKTGQNVDLLLEKILLEAEVLDMKANPNRLARAVVVEAELDKGRGITATVLVQKGTMRIGDSFVCGIWSGRIRAMFDERGQRLDVAGPSSPVQLIGFEGIPQAGDPLIVLEDEREARDISLRRQQLKREQDFRQRRRLTLDDISRQIREGEVRDLPVIVKADVDGSAEALADSLMKLSTDEVKVHVIHKAVGGISESDVILAVASRAIIIGFHVRPNLKARQLAEAEEIDIRQYSIIYDAINDVRNALEGMLAPKVSEEILCTIEVRDIFRISRIGTIAGCYVKDGRATRNMRVRLVRDGIEIYAGTLSSLKRFKDDVREVEQGYECGIGLENYNDVKVGDIVEGYRTVETKRTLE